jgi:hypothetical protein
MIKLFGMTLLLFVSLTARENPFFPSEGEVDIPMSTNIADDIKPLKRTAITLPSTARVIEGFTVTYKNLDGSVEEKHVALNNTVDWHLPLILSQSYNNNDSQIESTKKTNTFKKQKNGSFAKLDSLRFITLYASNREFKLVTKDSLMRDFLLTKPHRIVCDFKRDIDIRSYVKKMKESQIIKEFRIGNHKGYYRVVLELDGYYRYKVTKTKEGYIIKLL